MRAVWRIMCRYHDEGSLGIQVAYRKAHSLPLGSNLIRHHLGLIGLPEWMPEEQEIVRLPQPKNA